MAPSEQDGNQEEHPLSDAPIQRSLPRARYWVLAAGLLLGSWLVPAAWPVLRAGLLTVLALLPYVYIVLLSTWFFWLPLLVLLWFLLFSGSLLFNRVGASQGRYKIQVPAPAPNPHARQGVGRPG